MQTSPREKALATAKSGLSIAAAVESAILADLPPDADLLAIYAHRMRLCSQSANIWNATDLHDKNGECFDGSGRFWMCGQKLCPYCLQRQSQRVRKKLRAAIADQKLSTGEHWHFLTFTMPNLGIDLLDARFILNMAWSFFRKKKWFTTKIAGYFKSEEFTISKRKYHYHAHVLVRSSFIEYSSLRHFWTESLRTAFSRAGKTFTAATSDGMAIANCQRVGSLEDVVNEVAKYLTKSSSWKKIPKKELLDLCRIRRWPSMVEFGGCLRSDPVVAVSEDDPSSSSLSILDTTSLSDGDPDTNWRDTATTLGVAGYLDKLQEQIDEQSRIRMTQLRHHFPFARFSRLRPEQPIDIQRIFDLIFFVCDRAGRAPPIGTYKHLSAAGRLDVSRRFGLTLDLTGNQPQ